jgi:hypothetical protein
LVSVAAPQGSILVLVGLTAGWLRRRALRAAFGRQAAQGAGYGRQAALPVHVPWLPYPLGVGACVARLRRLWPDLPKPVHVLAYIGGGVVLRRLAQEGMPDGLGRVVWDRGPVQEQVAARLCALLPPWLLTLAGQRGVVDFARADLSALPFPRAPMGQALLIEQRASRLARLLGLGPDSVPAGAWAPEALLPSPPEALQPVLPEALLPVPPEALLPVLPGAPLPVPPEAPLPVPPEAPLPVPPGRSLSAAQVVRRMPLSHDEVYRDPGFLAAALEFLQTGRLPPEAVA